jgi:hypothetical protein
VIRKVLLSAPAAARTNELDAGQRRPIIGSEEIACWLEV